MKSIVTPSGASLLCQHPRGTIARSPARNSRVVSPASSRTVSSQRPEDVEQLVAGGVQLPRRSTHETGDPADALVEANQPDRLGGSSIAVARSNRTIEETACGPRS